MVMREGRGRGMCVHGWRSFRDTWVVYYGCTHISRSVGKGWDVLVMVLGYGEWFSMRVVFFISGGDDG